MASSERQQGFSALTVGGKTRIFGVFGYPVEHSLSPAMHNAAIAALGVDYLYIPFSVLPEDIGPAIRSLVPLGILGVNLTIPHKENVLPFLDEVTPEAKLVGAVNTVHNQAGRLIGHNTDGEGFAGSLKAQGFDPCGKRAVVLGAGGAARSVVFRLAREGASITIANRTLERAERLADHVRRAVGIFPEQNAKIDTVCLSNEAGLTESISGAELLVNTTSVGMSPHADDAPPIPPRLMHSRLLVYELIYNPQETRLLALARAAGAQTLNGMPMLVYQGAAAFKVWTGLQPPIDVMMQAVQDRLT